MMDRETGYIDMPEPTECLLCEYDTAPGSEYCTEHSRCPECQLPETAGCNNQLCETCEYDTLAYERADMDRGY